MNVADYLLPHRFLLNNSLRKEADALRSRINLYQTEYENKIELCKIELQNVEQEKQKEFDKTKEKLIFDFQNTHNVLDKLGNDIFQYVDNYLQRNSLLKTKTLMIEQLNLINEDYDFLSKQMILISNEIEILKKRQKELSTKTNVKDIIQLANNSGCDFDFNLEDNAKSLLQKINELIKNLDVEKSIERPSLLRLRNIIQERADYLPLINYINWVIQQKIQISKYISEKRNEIKEKKRTVKYELDEIKNEISIISIHLEKLAQKIRFYWARPIMVLNADISYAYLEIEQFKGEKACLQEDIRTVGNSLHELATIHSNDQEKWNSLQNRREELEEEIDNTIKNIKKQNKIICQKKLDRDSWFEKKNSIYQILKNNNTPLISDKTKKESDEILIIEERLGEIEEIKAKTKIKTEEIYEQEKAQIEKDYEIKIISLSKRSSDLEKERVSSISECDRLQNQINIEINELHTIRNNDRRGLIKYIINSPDSKAKKSEINKLQKLLYNEKSTLTQIEAKTQQVNMEINNLTEIYKNSLKNCFPRYPKPSQSESLEEKKLLNLYHTKYKKGYDKEHEN